MVNPPKKDDEQGYRHDLGHQQFSRSSLQSLPMVVNQRFTHQFRVQTPSLVLKFLWNPIFYSVNALFLDVFGTAIHNSFCFWRIPPIGSLKILQDPHSLRATAARPVAPTPLANHEQWSSSPWLAGKTARYQMLSISILHYSNSLTQRPEILGDFGMLLCTFCFYQRPKAAEKNTKQQLVSMLIFTYYDWPTMHHLGISHENWSTQNRLN